MADYYATLGVKKGASEKEVRSAYRRLARQYHPDVNQGDPAAESRFKEVNAAYEVLSDADKRRKYDKYGDRWEYADQIEEMQKQRGPAGGRRVYSTNGGGNFEAFEMDDLGGIGDVFSSFFGRRGSRGPRRGQDIESPVEVTLDEAYHGTSRTLQIMGSEACTTCGGSGQIAGAVCHVCEGAGEVARPRRLEVKIPAGVTNGSRVRVAGEGQPGASGGKKGDLRLVVSVRPHPRFERKGDDLIEDVDVPLTVAALGGEVEVPTLTGKVMLKVPPLTQNGRTFRLNGLGMPRLGKEGKGALHAKVRVRMPEQLTDRQRELLEELQASGV
jgi:DnaJ-class molecular chaperone